MKKYFVILFLMLLEAGYTWSLQSITLADTPLAKELAVSQIKITGDEFIVLRNATNTNMQLNNYWLQYFNDFDLARTSSASSSQLPAVWLQPGQEIMLAVGTVAACGPVWVSKLPFSFKDSAGMLQILNLSQTGGIIGYKPEDQVSWSSKTTDAVDIKGISGSAAAQIYYKTEASWASAATPPGCSAATTSTSSLTDTPAALSQSSTSPPSILLSENNEGAAGSNIPAAVAGLMAPLLSEILPNPGSPKTDANDEYIELYNPNDQVFDLSGFGLQAGTGGTYSYTFPDGQFSLQPYELKAFYSSITNLSLSNSGSEVKFLSPGDDVLSASDAYTDARDDYAWIFADGLWQWTSAPTPDARNIITSSSQSVLGSSDSVRPPAASSSQTYSPIVITELLPNPKSPQTDAENEFVEIYNPNKTAVNLAGYILVTGSLDNHKFTIKEGSLGPAAYKVFYSSTTHLTLSNNEGRAKILAPNGSQIDATADYAKAPEGQSWVYANGKWQWTTAPTPGKANIFSAPASTGSTAAGNRSNAANNSPAGPANSAAKSNALHPMILAGIGAAVLLYALYEYRHDVANLIYRLRRNRTVGRAAGQASQGAGVSGTQV
ncbi:lamin tail domain-containing protein [Candidatus Saccharibacteria bacterium]|nr:lamin tail domain-containing protein [Candidatus Saccharibacteria bacterium]